MPRCTNGCTYSRAMDQPYPRACVNCGETEPVRIEAKKECYHTWPSMLPYQKQTCMSCGASRMELEREEQGKKILAAFAENNAREALRQQEMNLIREAVTIMEKHDTLNPHVSPIALARKRVLGAAKKYIQAFEAGKID